MTPNMPSIVGNNPYKPRKAHLPSVPKIPSARPTTAPMAKAYTVRARRNAAAARSV